MDVGHTGYSGDFECLNAFPAFQIPNELWMCWIYSAFRFDLKHVFTPDDYFHVYSFSKSMIELSEASFILVAIENLAIIIEQSAVRCAFIYSHIQKFYHQFGVAFFLILPMKTFKTFFFVRVHFSLDMLRKEFIQV